MRSLRTLVSTSIALALAAGSGIANASPIFPASIKSDLSLSYDLGATHCTICHSTNAGGRGTVTQPFGLAMKAAGLQDLDTASLQTALTALEAMKVDSDCDGTPDVEQLKAGRNPNPPGEYIDGSGKATPTEKGCATSTDIPAYGCGARLAPVDPSPAGAAALGAAIGLALASRGRRRHAERADRAGRQTARRDPARHG